MLEPLKGQSMVQVPGSAALPDPWKHAAPVGARLGESSLGMRNLCSSLGFGPPGDKVRSLFWTHCTTVCQVPGSAALPDPWKHAAPVGARLGESSLGMRNLCSSLGFGPAGDKVCSLFQSRSVPVLQAAWQHSQILEACFPHAQHASHMRSMLPEFGSAAKPLAKLGNCEF